MLVVLFHYTTRYQQLFGHTSPPLFEVSWGHYGVNLFFMISGFVIFLTLDRISRPMDFVVSRFSRLFPVFWAAVATSFLITHLLAVPDRTVELTTAILNLPMIHGLFHVEHVDGVYWTLEIELLFYCLAFALYVTGHTKRVHLALTALILLQATSFLLERNTQYHIPWTINHLLILPQIAWFSLGILVYRINEAPNEFLARNIALGTLALLQIGLVDGPGLAGLAIVLGLGLWAAASGRLRLLDNGVLIWLGTISYPLYLVHQNIGYGVILQAEQLGLPTELAIGCAIAVALLLANSLTHLVERPAMAWIRATYRQRMAAA